MSDIHPWDLNEVHKGWQLTPDELEDRTGIKQTSKKFELAVMSLAKRLAKELKDDGRPCTVAIRKGCLRVLTDAEATEYNAGRDAQAVRCIMEAHNRQMAVDVSNLSAEQVEKHDRRLIASGLHVAALKEARTAIRKRFMATSGSPQLPEKT